MILQFDNVDKSYGKNHALDHFSATLTPGIYALMGPNGAGKTTLMNIFTDNLSADSGVINYDGEDIRKLGKKFREKLGFMPQFPGMYPNYTVEGFLRYIALLKDINRDDAEKQIREALEAVELADIPKRRISELSGGMKQRLALAQALIGDPEIVILDEPTAGLDPKRRISVRNYLAGISLKKIIIIATHVVSDIENIAKEAIFLKNGVITDFGPPHQLASKINGCVWEVKCETAELDSMQAEFDVINISQYNNRLILRILAEKAPTEDAVSVEPTLEDYYLMVFKER